MKLRHSTIQIGRNAIWLHDIPQALIDWANMRLGAFGGPGFCRMALESTLRVLRWARGGLGALQTNSSDFLLLARMGGMLEWR